MTSLEEFAAKLEIQWISAKRLNSVGVVSLDEGWAGLKALHPSREDWEEDGRRGD